MPEPGGPARSTVRIEARPGPPTSLLTLTLLVYSPLGLPLPGLSLAAPNEPAAVTAASGGTRVPAQATRSAPSGEARPYRPPWGFLGHEMAARAAVTALPDEMPDFFRSAEEQLAWLASEPDRWRSADRPAMDRAWTYDHYVNLENVPPDALDAPDRFRYLAALYRGPPGGRPLDEPERDAGFLPYRILELYDRLALGWARWQAATPGSDERRWLEERIVQDAGILGHYVTDGSQPHHVTMHFDGWSPDAPNPEGFTTARGLHARFERSFVDEHVGQADVDDRMPARLRRPPGDMRAWIRRYLDATAAEVPRLYRLERDVGFDPEGPASPEARDFAAGRLAAGAEMLALLWWSAWSEGAP